jgi:phosphopantetheinyl transferase (holo-ACP synthase)
MTHAGNDIVSLHAINPTRTRQHRFYSKILADSEVTLYNEGAFASIPFDVFVWLCWSIKESAFKYLQRSRPTLIFSPTRLVVTHLSLPLRYSETKFGESSTEGSGFDDRMALKGIVSCGTDTLFSRSLVYHEVIHSVVLDQDNFENTGWGIKLIDQPDPDSQSMVVRKFLVDRLKSLFPGDKISIGKSTQGFPLVLGGKKELGISVSLSHHGRMVAYTFSGSSAEALLNR